MFPSAGVDKYRKRNTMHVPITAFYKSVSGSDANKDIRTSEVVQFNKSLVNIWTLAVQKDKNRNTATQHFG